MQQLNRLVHILVIDNVRSERDRLEHELHEVGFSYQMESCDGDEGALCKYLDTHKNVDVVLCPFSLPGANALQMLKTLRECGLSVPFVLLAFDLAEDIAIELLNAGMEDYILRTSIKRLPVVIRKAMQRHQISMELQASQEQLQTSEMALRSMVRNMPMPVVMLDKDLCFIVASDLWMEQSGHVAGTIVGKHYHELIPAQPEVWKQVQQRALQGESFAEDGEKFVFHGKEYWTRWKMNPWYDSAGNVGGLVVFSEDITSDRQLQLSLEKSETSLREAQHIANIGSWEWQLGTSRVWGSDQMHMIFGMTIEDGTKPWSALLACMHPEDRAMMQGMMQSDLLRSFSETLNFRIVSLNGEVKYVRSYARIVANEHGVPTYLRGTLQDVTSERLEQMDKDESRRLLDKVFEAVPDAMIYTDPFHSIIWVSDSVLSVFGYSPEEVIGKSTEMFFPSTADYIKAIQDVLALGDNHDPYTSQRQYKRKDGSLFLAETIGVVIKRPDGSLQGFLASTRDISDRMAVEQRLQASEQLFQDMAHNIAEVFWLTDYKANKVLYMSPQYERLFGMTVQSIYDDSTSWSTYIHPDDRQNIIEKFRDAPLGTYHVEYRILLPDGRLYWVRDRAFPIKNDKGEVLRIAGISQDVTAEKTVLA